MKKIENTFTVTGFVGKDAEIRSFTSASVARFSPGRRPSGEIRRSDQPGVRFPEF